MSQATGRNIENLGIERGHRTLVVTRKGYKLVTMPLARTAGPSVWLMTGFNTLSNTSYAG